MSILTSQYIFDQKKKPVTLQKSFILHRQDWYSGKKKKKKTVVSIAT